MVLPERDYLPLLTWIQKRERVRRQRALDLPPPWTDDAILREYRFCNVHREDDKVTQWIAKNWRDPYHDCPDVWFAMVVARFINWPDTLAEIGFPVPWNPAVFLSVMASRRKKGLKCYGGAYMIRAGEAVDKAVYQERDVFTPMWNHAIHIRPREGDSLNSFHVVLSAYHGMGSFMAGQIVADMKYVEPLRLASDWHTFACSGPGSRRGLNRLLGRPVQSAWTEEEWRLRLTDLHNWLNANWEIIHAQDVQNCLCEFDKYERVRLGEGRPRARYRYA